MIVTFFAFHTYQPQADVVRVLASSFIELFRAPNTHKLVRHALSQHTNDRWELEHNRFGQDR